jgi:hypothetical protein
MRRVLEASVAWVSRTPWVEVLPWPNGAPFAGVVEATGDGADAAAWKREIEAAALDGGVARLAVPSRAPDRTVIERRLADAMGALGRRGAGIATRGDVSTWTRQRAGVDASVRRVGPRRLAVEVTNFGRTKVERVVLRVYLNAPALRAEAEATKLLQANASVRNLHPNAEVLDLALPELDGRASAAFSLDYEPASSGEG